MVLAVAVAGRLRRYAASLHPSRMSSAAAASVISLSSAGCNELLPAATPLFDALQLPLETESLFVRATDLVKDMFNKEMIIGVGRLVCS
jgi:hypothetical protein